MLTTDGHENRSYDLTGPEALSNEEIAAVFSSVLGRKTTYVNVSEEAARDGMLQTGMPEWLIDALLELYRINNAGYSSVLSDHVKEITGREPLSFEQFVKDHKEFFQE